MFFPAERTWEYSRRWASPRTWDGSIGLRNTRVIPGRLTAVIPPTPRLVGRGHPFALLDYSIVHNGEISSYDANRRYIEMFGYKCTLQTDTEVITYIADYLLRRQGLSLEETAGHCGALLEHHRQNGARPQKNARISPHPFSGLLVTGPFSIILGFDGGLMALNDRLKLRSMVVAEKNDKVFVSSEEAAIRVMEPDAEKHIRSGRRRTGHHKG